MSSARGDLKGQFERLAADIRAAGLVILTDPAISEEERAGAVERLTGHREDMKTIRRVVFDRLPGALPLRMRVHLAGGVGRMCAGFVLAVRCGETKRTRHEAARWIATRRESARQAIVKALAVLDRSGEDLDRLTLSRFAYSTTLNLLAKEHGIECSDGDLFSERLSLLLRDVGRVLNEPFEVPEPLAENVPRPESELDHAVTSALGSLLSLRAQARLIVELRQRLDLPETTEEQAYQRLRRHRANRRRD